MITNYWEELDMPNEILEFHEKSLEEFHIPKWAMINCPYCGKPLQKRAIREIGMKFNSRNMGDIFLEFCCDSCYKMNVLYYRKEVKNTEDFLPFLTGEKSPISMPELEEDMYKLKYNNLIDLMYSKKEC